jgi:hypothetical protein
MPLSPRLSVSLPPAVAHALGRVAAEAGLRPTMLVRGLVVDHLEAGGQVAPGVAASARVIRHCGGRPRSIVIRGMRFRSIRSAAAKLGVSASAIHKAEARGRVDQVGLRKARQARVVRGLYEATPGRQNGVMQPEVTR